MIPPPKRPRIELDPLARLADLVVQRLQPQLRQIMKAITAMSEDINKELAVEVAQEQALAAAIAKNTDTLKGLQTQLADALEAAKSSGLTPEQLAAFDAIHAKVSDDLAALTAADAPAA